MIRPEGSPELPPGHQEGFRIEGPVCAPERAWALVGDTDWLNRAGENSPVVAMGLEAQRDGFPVLVGAFAGPGGMKLPFVEHFSSWVAGRFFRQVRDVDSPLLRRTDYRAELLPVEGGVRPVIELSVVGPTWAAPLRRLAALGRLERGWRRSLEALGGVDPGGARSLGPEATAAVRRWRELAAPELVDRFVAHFERGRAGELSRMRAWELADRWLLDRDEVLEALVVGVEAGATELFWSARCRRCYGQLGGGRMLSDLADHADCPACGVSTATDLGESVEVLFSPHPSVVPAIETRFCTIYPTLVPAQHAVLTLAPGQELRMKLPLPPGEWRLGPGQGEPDLHLEAGASGEEGVEWEEGAEGSRRLRAGEVELQLHNGPRRRRLYLLRGSDAVPVVPASRLTTMDRFRRRLGHQVLARDLRVGVRAVALLFTDLGGSTAMYEELGDARAFAVVRDHFRLLREVAAAEGGTVVKTIGDAVMAVFFDAPAAVRAALGMLDRFEAWAGGLDLAHPPSLKVGVHVGPALVVHTDQSGLDYFGGSVNLAARAQGAAAGGELVLTEAVMAAPGVMDLLGGREVEPGAAALKGIGEVCLWRVRGRG